MSRGYCGGHLGKYLEEYVDGSLPECAKHLAARHIVACSTCREDVAMERAIVERLRSLSLDPARYANLVAGLLAVEPPVHGVQVDAPRPSSVVMISPDAPPQYSRRRRSQLLAVAALAVGCVAVMGVTSVAPQRTAPGEQLVAHHHDAVVSDEVSAPRILSVGYRTGVNTGGLVPRAAASGTIVP